MDGKNLISVIIVNFNSKNYLVKCVNSVLNSTIPVEIFVVDNSSEDKSLSLLKETIPNEPRLQIIENEINTGFASACNQALPLAKGNYILFLNPDCVIKPDTLKNMVDVMDSYPEAGMTGCLVRNPDGSEQAGSRRYIPTPWRSLIRVLKLSRLFSKNPELGALNLSGQPLPDHPVPLEAISGAFMFVRQKAMKEVGPMDGEYFLHCEDLDWFMRFSIAGWKILFAPGIEIMHAKGVCSIDRQVWVELHKHKGMVRFYRKFFRQRYPDGLMYLVVIAVWSRFVLLATYLSLKRLVKVVL
jgi:GT2 family glycosyltransferase